MNANGSPARGLQIKRLIRAPIARVFAAWTTPADVARWIGPGPWHVPIAEIDLRPGGEYRFQMVHEGHQVDVFGAYREVQAPSRLVYTWNTRGALLKDSGETVVTVVFVEVDGATEVQLTQEKFNDARTCADHRDGWKICLTNLKQFLTRGKGR